MIRWQAALLASLPLMAPVLPAEGVAGTAPVYLLDPAGKVLVWTPGREALDPISLPWPSVNDLAVFDGGKRLLLLTENPLAIPDRHDKGKGLLVVLEAFGSTLRPVLKAPFDGRGLRVVVSRDSRRAYVLAFRPDRSAGAVQPGEPQSGRGALIHAFDIDKGRVTESLPLPKPATSITLAPGGRRLFVSLPDRILSCSTTPLASSWFYRSPGLNLGLSFAPGGRVLYAVRGRQVALFDPELLAALPEAERRARDDDATTVLPLPETAAALLFSDDDSLAVAFGGTSHLFFFDTHAGEAAPGLLPDGFPDRPSLVRPIRFTAPGDALLVAVFPEGRILTVSHRPIEAPVATRADAPSKVEAPAPTPEPAASTPEASIPIPEGAPARSQSPPRAVAEAVLRGQVRGDHKRVTAIVIFGPNSILKEQVRAAPGPSGEWSVPLPPPGAYRVVPVGPGSKPLRTRPNFQTVVVKGEEGLDGIDFAVEGAL